MLGKVLHMPMDELRSEEQMSSNTSVGLSQTLFLSLLEAKHSVQMVSKPFEASGDIRPIHCRKALNALEKLDKLIKTNCQLLPETGYAASDLISKSTFPSNYQLLNTMYHTQEQAIQLINLIDDHRLACLTPSQRLGQKRRVIQEQLSTLWDYLASLLDQLQKSYEVALP
jgi:hypothetical protein